MSVSDFLEELAAIETDQPKRRRAVELAYMGICSAMLTAEQQAEILHLLRTKYGFGPRVDSGKHTCPGCGATVIGHERCGDPSRPECRPREPQMTSTPN